MARSTFMRMVTTVCNRRGPLSGEFDCAPGADANGDLSRAAERFLSQARNPVAAAYVTAPEQTNQTAGADRYAHGVRRRHCSHACRFAGILQSGVGPWRCIKPSILLQSARRSISLGGKAVRGHSAGVDPGDPT